MSAQSAWHLILWIHFLSASLWTGGLFFSAVVAAPAIQRSMASRALVTQILSGLFKRLHAVEFVAFSLLLITTLSSYRFIPEQSESVWKILACVILMGLISLTAGLGVTRRLEALQESVPGMALDMPGRSEFDRLHRIYVGLLALNQALGIVLIYQSVVIF